MAIPDFQSVMLPLMQAIQDGQEHRLGDVLEVLAHRFNLSTGDREEMLSSGRQSRFDNRVAWALTHLSKAQLIERTGRGRFRMSARGHDVLSRGLQRIDTVFLSQFPEFRDFRKAASRADTNGRALSVPVEDAAHTPLETLEASYLSLRSKTAQELLERILASSPRFFETLVVDLLVAMGYGGSRKDAGQAIGRSGDGGVDGIIKEDRLGLDVVHVQAKRWRDTVGRPVVQGFAGSLDGYRARKGVLITTSQFSQEARGYVADIEKKIVLIDGEQLVQLMMDYGVGASDVATYTIKQIDLDYFEDAPQPVAPRTRMARPAARQPCGCRDLPFIA